MKAIPYSYICLEGNIGAGKTTLSQMLAKDLHFNLVLEEFAENPFLEYFYKDKERHSFTVELFFLAERHKQLQETFGKTSLFNQVTLADYTIIKSLLFAKMNLNQDEYKLFYRLYLSLTQHLRRPDIIIYLHRPINTLHENIFLRGREYELKIPSEYLLSIQENYFNFFKNQIQIPVVIVDLQGHDFLNNLVLYNEIKNIIYNNYLPGVHHLYLSNNTKS